MQINQTAGSSPTSIKSSQAHDTRRRQMTPLNGSALLAVFRPTQTPDYRFPIRSSKCVCMPSCLDCPILPRLFLCIPSPSLSQHLCWVHAQVSDKALCVPSLGKLPSFPPGCLPRHPGNLTTAWPSPPTIPLQPTGPPKASRRDFNNVICYN